MAPRTICSLTGNPAKTSREPMHCNGDRPCHTCGALIVSFEDRPITTEKLDSDTEIMVIDNHKLEEVNNVA